MRKNAVGKYRWVIAVLLLFSTTINYMDRQVISYLKEFFSTPVSKGGFGWTNTDFAYVTSFFTAFYAGVTILAGWVIDKIGTKLGLAFSLIIWSVFGMLNALAGSTVVLHAIIRSLFGIGEAGNFPASIKTIAEWFPKKERALATGIFNSGANLGAMAASVFVPWCMVYWGNVMGYKMAYLITGASGFIWLIFWFAFYTTPGQSKRLSKEEYDFIHSDDEITHAVSSEEPVTKQKASWFSLLKYPQTWAFFTGKFLTDGIWWFLLFWLPDYLKKQFGLTGEQVILPTFIVYGVAILGSTFGGSLPLFLINKGMSVYKARMTAMLIIALFPLVLLTTQYFGNRDLFGTNAIVLAVTLICIAAAAHQAWSANIFTTVSDMFPKTAVGSVTGIGGMAGGIGGVLFQLLAGRLTDHFKATPQIAYGIMFTICALAYITAWAIIRILTAKSRHVIL